jgi:iron complex transport system substrate-binding protein
MKTTAGVRAAPQSAGKTARSRVSRLLRLTPVAVLALAAFASCGLSRAPSPEAGPAARKDGPKLRVISLAPAATSILIDIGAADLLVGTDTWSTRLPDAPRGLPAFDMMKPDVERIAALKPDLLLVSRMTEAGSGVNPFKLLEGPRTRVVVTDTGADLAAIAKDVETVAALVGREKEGERTIERMAEAVKKIEAVARKIPEDRKRTVVFEIESAPWIYSFGKGVYLDDLLSRAGAINAFAGESGWIAVSAEAVAKANPDVILTNVVGDDPVAEIRARPGWGALKAVREGRVYRIDNTASSQPAPSCAKALAEIAEAVYPEYFK